MATSHPNISSPPFTPPSNNGEKEELDKQSNLELISFLESSFRRSEFIKIAGVLKAREESAKAESLKDLSATVAELQGKNGSLEKELVLLRNKEAESEEKKKHCVRLESELAYMKKRRVFLESQLAYMKNDCMTLRESEKLAQEKIKVLMEEVQKEKEECANRRAHDEVNIALKRKYLEVEQMEIDLIWVYSINKFNWSRLEKQFISLKEGYSALEVFEKKTNKICESLEEKWKLENARNQRIAMFDSLKDKCPPTETWILQFFENNPHLMEKVREKPMNCSEKNCSKRKLSDGLNISPVKEPKKTNV